MVVFISNFISEHQIPICEAFYHRLGDNFQFIATTSISALRLSQGFEDQSSRFPYIIRAFGSQEAIDRGIRAIDEADVVIWGNAPFSFVENRLESGKMTFRYSERFFKKGLRQLLRPRALAGNLRQFTRFRRKPFYLLGAGAYVSDDARFIGAFPGKAFRWGYFRQIEIYPTHEELFAPKRPASVIWTGRFIDWKHPEIMVEVARRLRDEGCDFTVSMIGPGDMTDEIRHLVEQYGLTDRISLPGALPPAQVREQMRQSEIFLFTSDRQEGWGVVLNEAMNAGCAVVASHAAGSTPFLVKHRENGLIFESGNVDDAFACVRTLLDDDALRRRYATAAYETVIREWNAENAADRLLRLIDVLRENPDAPSPFADGVCSRADALPMNWFSHRKGETTV